MAFNFITVMQLIIAILFSLRVDEFFSVMYAGYDRISTRLPGRYRHRVPRLWLNNNKTQLVLKSRKSRISVIQHVRDTMKKFNNLPLAF